MRLSVPFSDSSCLVFFKTNILLAVIMVKKETDEKKLGKNLMTMTSEEYLCVVKPM